MYVANIHTTKNAYIFTIIHNFVSVALKNVYETVEKNISKPSRNYFESERYEIM